MFSTIPITLDVFLRKLFGITVFESFELSGYAFAAGVAFGFGYASTSKAHIRIDAVVALDPQMAVGGDADELGEVLLEAGIGQFGPTGLRSGGLRRGGPRRGGHGENPWINAHP